MMKVRKDLVVKYITALSVFSTEKLRKITISLLRAGIERG
jgi:hypothetical protein